MNELNNIIEERLSLLPNIIKEIIANSDWIKKVAKICRENKLLLDQETQIENMTIMMMIGVIDPRKIINELSEIGLDKEKSIIVAQSLEQEIFSPIMSELVKVFDFFEQQDQQKNDDFEVENMNSFKDNHDYISKTNPADLEHNESREEILKQIEDEDKEGNNIINFIQDNEEKNKAENSLEKESMLEKLKSPFSTKEENLSVNKAENTQNIDPYREIPQ